MNFYAWTISKRGCPDIKEVTTVNEIRDVLRVLDLPGVAPPEFTTLEAEVADHGSYHHDVGSMDQWSLTWTKVSGDSLVVD
ncbi:hypothetical protein [Pararhizobium qamdonense]|uniref:hypothetical protein n=1 Tax=Pararhizobium qamdonense TaxID=3031126 RepID=UPI0023E2439D|nr:hypothetical protein [Pararhizobium qamdonense]